MAGGINTYGYGAANPLAFVDPLGLDVEVIVSYRQFYGHVDIRINNRVYGSGRFDVPGRELRSGGLAGTNVLRVTDAAAHKQSLAACGCEATGYVLDVTPQQEAEVLRFFRNQMAASSPVPARPNSFILPDDYSIATNNCATNARDALQSGLPWFLDPLFLGVMAPGAMETRVNTVARPLVKERTQYSTPVSPAHRSPSMLKYTLIGLLGAFSSATSICSRPRRTRLSYFERSWSRRMRAAVKFDCQPVQR